jgi:hypothetical protein
MPTNNSELHLAGSDYESTTFWDVMHSQVRFFNSLEEHIASIHLLVACLAYSTLEMEAVHFS